MNLNNEITLHVVYPVFTIEMDMSVKGWEEYPRFSKGLLLVSSFRSIDSPFFNDMDWSRGEAD